MTNEQERRREEQMIAACAGHIWNVSDRSDFESKGITTEAQLKDRIREVINDPRTRAFSCQPKMDLSHPKQGEQFPREFYLLREGSRTTVVILNGSRVTGTAWVGSGNQERRLLDAEVKKNNLEHPPEIVVGGRPALLERERHQQLVEQVPQPKRESIMEQLDREAKERGDAPLVVRIVSEPKLERTLKLEIPRLRRQDESGS